MSQGEGKRVWKGCWIWAKPGLAVEHRNEYMYARRTFRLTSPPVAAPVRITADNRYQLFVNGRFLCRGPARCEPRYQSYDEVDLAPLLRVGNNCVAALVHHYGESTFQSIERGGWGFLLDGQVRCRRGKPVPIHSDESWKTHAPQAYNRPTARYTVQLGFQEDFDAARDVPGWTQTDFDDRDWQPAWVYGLTFTMPFERLEPRGIPLEMHRPERFARLAGEFTGVNGPGYLTAGDLGPLIADETRSFARRPIARNTEAALSAESGCMTIAVTPPGRFHALVLDAGRETCGFLRLDVEAAGGEIIDFYYSEHIRPDGSIVVRALNGGLASMADRYRCRKGRQQHQFFAWKGFRYVLVVFRDVRRPLKVHHLGYTFTSYPVERRGAFECSDPLLNRIWETGVWTQQLCMHDAYMDCPWREQAQWWGDARIQWRVNMAAFGDTALMRRGLTQAAQSQAFHGLTYGLFPCEIHGCILPDYTLVWICSLWDYYWYSGDDSPIREHFDRVLKALSWFEVNAGREQLVHHPGPGMWLFLDWAPLYKSDCNATFNFQHLEALQLAARMARLIGRRDVTRRLSATAARVERAIVRAFWDPAGKRFFEGYHRATRRPFRQTAQHGNAYAILTGVEPRWHGRIADRLVWIAGNHDRLAPANTGGNVHRKEAKFPIASPFFYAYVLEAMFRAGRGPAALDTIRKLWGRMLDDGATSWYESWEHGPEVYGNSSACHAWSASPTYHLSEQFSGVSPIAPGFARVRIAPRTLGLEYARVCLPTPRGLIHVEWERNGRRKLDLSVRLPKGITGVLELPRGGPRSLKPGSHKLEQNV